jgi:hypothetical protein
MGSGSMVKVHRLVKVGREDVILPRQTLATLDRNVAGFMKTREQLKKLQFQAHKGLLFMARQEPARRISFAIWPRAVAGPHDSTGDGGTGRVAQRVLPTSPFLAAVHDGHRGC